GRAGDREDRGGDRVATVARPRPHPRRRDRPHAPCARGRARLTETAYSRPMARVLVTGGAGFVGSHVAEAFLGRGDDVLVIDDLSTGKRENVPDGAAFAELDIAEPAALEDSFAEGADLVCHLAAQASVTVSVDDPLLDCTSNVLGTLNVCESARRRGAPVVFASTGGALYGDAAPRPTPEGFA